MGGYNASSYPKSTTVWAFKNVIIIDMLHANNAYGEFVEIIFKTNGIREHVLLKYVAEQNSFNT